MVALPTGHRWTRRRLSGYLEGELPRRTRRRLEAHLAACPDCRRTVVTLAAVVGALRAGRAQSPDVLPERTVERLRPRL